MNIVEQLASVRERLTELDPNNRDHLYEISELKTREAELSRQLKQEEAEAELQRQHEERIQASVVTVQNSLDTASIEGFTIRELCVDENRYQLLNIWIQEQFARQAEDFSKQIQQEVSESKRLRDELNDMQDLNEAKDAEISTLRQQNYQLNLSNQQLNEYRDNAANIIAEKDAEIERLNGQVDDLRTEAAVGARKAYQVTNLESARELAEKIRASQIPVTVMEYADMLGKEMRIVLAETGEEKTIGFLEKGKYRLVDNQEAAEVAERFRQAQMELAASHTPEAVAEPVTFPEAKAPSVDLGGMAGGQPEASERDHGREREAESDDSTQSLEERVKALEIAVFGGAA